MTKQVADLVVKRSPGGKIELDLSRFGRYHDAIQRRLLRHCLQTLSVSRAVPDREVIERLLRLCEQTRGKISLPDQIYAEVIPGKLVLGRKLRMIVQHDLEINKPCRLDWPRLTIRNRLVDGTVKDVVLPAVSRKVTVDWNKLKPPLYVRSIRPGDRFQPLGMKGTKKIGDYFTDSHVPTVYRDEQLLVCDERGVVWVVGHQIDDRVKLDDKTRKVLHIEFSRRKKV
jgi:tRNA(Ile)-lysidine synthase